MTSEHLDIEKMSSETTTNTFIRIIQDLKKVPDEARDILLNKLHHHAHNESEKSREMVRSYFSSGRKFAGYKVHEVTDFHYVTPTEIGKDFGVSFDCNPFSVPSETLDLDLLTDSGTNNLNEEQKEIAVTYRSLVPSIQMFSYARSQPREHLQQMFCACFGDQFEFYPTLQGRAAEKMLLKATVEVELINPGDRILCNRPFDTTKGHILATGLYVDALTPIPAPKEYYESDSVFMGNIQEEVYLENFGQKDVKILLVTLTDNGSGGQPVSMANLKFLAEKSREKGHLIWIDACRIFENAFFIKTFEDGYTDKTILEIGQEILSLCDFATMSFKKMYSHAGGGILINKTSSRLSGKLYKLDRSIKRQTTTDYGNGYRSYSGLTGGNMVEIMTGLIMSTDEEIVGYRIGQVGRIGSFLRQKYENFPVIAGGHALYIAADQVLPRVQLTDCPAEYLNAILMASLKVRGCGLGLLVYGGRMEDTQGKVRLEKCLSMDSLRLAIPRNQYSGDEIISQLMVIGHAFERGIFKEVIGGLYPKEYIDDGFYHFGANYDIRNVEEFDNIVFTFKTVAKVFRNSTRSFKTLKSGFSEVNWDKMEKC